MTGSKIFTDIYLNRDLYVPAFDIKINGQPLKNNATKDVIDVRYTDSVDQIDTFEITLNNWDANEQDFKYTGSTKTEKERAPLVAGVKPSLDRDPQFDPGQEIELWMGYLKPTITTPTKEVVALRLMLTGIIIGIAPTFPASGQPTVKISGQNVLRKFMSKQETHVYEGLSISEIATKIGKDRKFKLGKQEIPILTTKQQEPKNDHVLQNNQFDIVFLLQLAHQSGYDLVLKQADETKKIGQHLFFGLAGEDRSIYYRLEWGKSLINFQPKLTIGQQVFTVTVKGWDAAKGKAINVTVDRSQLKNRGLRDRRELDQIEQGFREKSEIIVDKPFRNEAEAREYASGRLQKNACSLVTTKGSTIGTPDLRAGSTVEIAKLGNLFNGNYLLKTTTHTINAGGYITEFEGRLEEQN